MMSKVVSLTEFALLSIRRKNNIPIIRSSKGYPEKRDPAAEGPSGILPVNLGACDLHKLRLHYGPAYNRLEAPHIP